MYMYWQLAYPNIYYSTNRDKCSLFQLQAHSIPILTRVRHDMWCLPKLSNYQSKGAEFFGISMARCNSMYIHLHIEKQHTVFSNPSCERVSTFHGVSWKWKWKKRAKIITVSPQINRNNSPHKRPSPPMQKGMAWAGPVATSTLYTRYSYTLYVQCICALCIQERPPRWKNLLSPS